MPAPGRHIRFNRVIPAGNVITLEASLLDDERPGWELSWCGGLHLRRRRPDAGSRRITPISTTATGPASCRCLIDSVPGDRLQDLCAQQHPAGAPSRSKIIPGGTRGHGASSKRRNHPMTLPATAGDTPSSQTVWSTHEHLDHHRHRPASNPATCPFPTSDTGSGRGRSRSNPRDSGVQIGRAHV